MRMTIVNKLRLLFAWVIVGLFVLPSSAQNVNDSTLVHNTLKLVSDYTNYGKIGGPREKPRDLKRFKAIFGDSCQLQTYTFSYGEGEGSGEMKSYLLEDYLKAYGTVFSDGVTKINNNYYVDYSSAADGKVKVYMNEILRGTNDLGEYIFSKSVKLLILDARNPESIVVSNVLDVNTSIKKQVGKSNEYFYFGEDPYLFEPLVSDPTWAYKLGFNVSNPSIQMQNISDLTLNSGSGFQIGINYYHNLGKTFAIGAGLNYARTQFGYSATNLDAEYKSTDANGNEFKQLLTQNDLYNEDLSIQNLRLQVLGKLKLGKINVSGFAGPAFAFGGASDYSTNLSYEAIYGIDEAGGLHYVEEPSARSLSITRETVTQNSGETDLYFGLMQNLGYNVALDQDQDRSFDTEYSPGMHFGVNLSYRFSLGAFNGEVGAEFAQTTYNVKQQQIDEDYFTNLSSIDNLNPLIYNASKLSVSDLGIILIIYL